MSRKILRSTTCLWNSIITRILDIFSHAIGFFQTIEHFKIKHQQRDRSLSYLLPTLGHSYRSLGDFTIIIISYSIYRKAISFQTRFYRWWDSKKALRACRIFIRKRNVSEYYNKSVLLLDYTDLLIMFNEILKY